VKAESLLKTTPCRNLDQNGQHYAL